MSEARAVQVSSGRERDQLFTLLYDELHRIAQRELKRGAGVTLTPTSLLHETYLNLLPRHTVEFLDPAHFMSYASRAMRGLIIDYMRERQTQKRGGEFEITSMPTEPGVPVETDGDGQLHIEKLHEALEILTQIDARLAECVDLKFFCGFSFGEIAKLREVSERTVQRDWDKARTLLHHFLSGPAGGFDPFSL